MEKKSFLLPHVCQKIGLALLVLFILFVLLEVFANGNTIEIPDWLTNPLAWTFYALPSVSVMLICLSREKIEDEYISHIRGRAVFIVVLIGFIASLITNAARASAAQLYGPDTVGSILTYAWWFTNALPISLLYILIFKGTLFINWVKTRGNGE